MTALADPYNDRSRPGSDSQTASQMSITNDPSMVAATADTRPRCCRCGHVVFSQTSIRIGIGLACRRALARAAQEVAA